MRRPVGAEYTIGTYRRFKQAGNRENREHPELIGGEEEVAGQEKRVTAEAGRTTRRPLASIALRRIAMRSALER